MKTIWKYELAKARYNTFQIPKGAKILSVQIQNGNPCIWAIVDEEAALETRVFYIFGTGHLFDLIDYKFIGTVQVNGLVLHIFESNS